MSSKLLEPQSHETETASESLDSEGYVSKVLQKHDTVDTEGIIRPAYIVNGREVVFRTRQEAPTYEDTQVTVIGGAGVYPLEREAWNETLLADEQTDESAVRAYVDSHQGDAPRLVVTNTAEGIVSAAAVLAKSDEESVRLKDLADHFSQGKTWDEAESTVIDTLLAAVSVGDDGELSNYVDINGWAVALAALSGDSKAQEIIDAKRPALINNERERASVPSRIEWVKQSETEPIPLEEIALVHSTVHAIERDEDGAVILRTAGQLRDDKYPRASLHFTLNSRVGDVYSMGEKQEWDDSQKTIVANFKQVVDTSQTLPNRMDGVDTWFMLNPGQTLRLPGALVVEPVEKTESGQVIEQSEDGVSFVLKDEYSREEHDSYADLAREYGTYSPKEIALRIAMKRVGVPVNLMDVPSSNGHGMASEELAGRVYATASSLGLHAGKHFETPEANMENNAFFTMPRLIGKLAWAGYAWEQENMTTYPGTAIEARRQALASGFYPARPNVLSDKAIADAARYDNSGI